jgi:hypothetical protein
MEKTRVHCSVLTFSMSFIKAFMVIEVGEGGGETMLCTPFLHCHPHGPIYVSRQNGATHSGPGMKRNS